LREGGIERYPENINTRHLQEQRERERGADLRGEDGLDRRG